MLKLGLIGSWGVFPPAGLTFANEKPRTITIGINTTEKVAITVQELAFSGNRGREGQPVLLAAVDGLQTLEFRVQGPVKLRAEFSEPESTSAVWFQTDEGRNFAIDADHLRDLTVPMIGRVERNPEVEAFRFEQRQMLREQANIFAEFMAFQKAQMAKTVQEEKPNGTSDQTQQHPKPEPGNGDVSADSAAKSGDVRSGAEKRPERAVPAHDQVQGTATESDKGGGTP